MAGEWQARSLENSEGIGRRKSVEGPISGKFPFIRHR
jgi:hypothetical protein